MRTPLYSTYNGTSSIHAFTEVFSELSTFYGIVEDIMERRSKKYLAFSLFTFVILMSMLWCVLPTTKTEAENSLGIENHQNEQVLPIRGKYVVINLATKIVLLKNGTTTLATIPLSSQGKPGSYYETLAGEYTSDYKEPLHFSSIGHVYMPYSVHLFGNYFIHGIPYYPNGEDVISTYSGGCIRLANSDAERVYNFVTTGMHIIITRNTENDFVSTPATAKTLVREDMMRLMVALISLETLTQDDEILSTDGFSITTRRTLLRQLLTAHDDRVATFYAKASGQEQFISAMNKKAEALGLTNTHFTRINGGVATTGEDYLRFMNYLRTYKSYLFTF